MAAMDNHKSCAVMRILTFADVYDWNTGWKVDLKGPHAESVLEPSIAVRVGVFDTTGGSSFVKMLYGRGSDTSQLGMRVIMHQDGESDRSFAFLEVGALNSPMDTVNAYGQDPSKALEVLQEPKRQENFLRQVAFEFGQVYILVVGETSRAVELEILQLMQVAEMYGVKKQVIVLHKTRRDQWIRFQETFKLRHSTVEFGGQPVDVLHPVGLADRAVQIRHLLLTCDEPTDPHCENAAVIEYIRMLLHALTPSSGSILAGIAKIATDCAKSMVRLPPSKNIEIRYHRGRGVLLGGEVEEAEAKQMAEWAKRPPKTEAVARAEEEVAEYKLKAESGPLTAAEKEEMEAAEERLTEALIEAPSQVKPLVLDAETLIPLNHHQIACRPVALGTTTPSSGDGHVKYNVSRVRATAMGKPHWSVFVHTAMPGLAPEELVKLCKTLRWGQGVTMEAKDFSLHETLKLHFKVWIVSTPAGQIDSLNHQGMPVRTEDKRVLGGAIRIDASHDIFDKGTRPFSNMRDRVEVDVVVHTNVENCVWEIEPIVSYDCGVLTVMVCAEPSEDERAAPENLAWISGECEPFDFGTVDGAAA